MISLKRAPRQYLLWVIAVVLAVLIGNILLKTVFSNDGSLDYAIVSKEKLRDPAIEKCIAQGIKQRKIYIDNFHGLIPANPYILDSLRITYDIGQDRLTNEQTRLYGCGILLMNYAIGKPELSVAEYKILKKFIANGGRVMLLCPIWVWEAYDKKAIKSSHYYKIAQYYGLELSSLYVEPPLISSPLFYDEQDQAFIGGLNGVFSSIVCGKNAFPVIMGKDHKIAAAIAFRDSSKLFVWSHNNLFDNDIVSLPSGNIFIGKIFDEIFSLNTDLLGKYNLKKPIASQLDSDNIVASGSKDRVRNIWLFINWALCFFSIIALLGYGIYFGMAQYGRVKYNSKHIVSLAAFLLAMAIAYYINNLSFISILIQANFGTGTHDVGVYDQVIWLASRFMEPFSTLGRMSVFGIHASFYCILLAPLFWIWSTINILYIGQTIFIALSSIPIFLYAQKKLGNAYFSLMLALSFLLYPAMSNMNLDNFHPEAISIFFLVWTLYFLLTSNFKAYYPFLILSIIGKEDIALSVIFIGIYLWIKNEKKHAIATMIIGISWLLFCLRILMPWANGVLFKPSEQPLVYSHWFGGFSGNIFNPLYYFTHFTDAESVSYIFNLFKPLLFIPLLSPVTLLILVPSLAANLLTGCGYFKSLFYHYDCVITGVLFFSVIEAVYFVINSKYGKNIRSIFLLIAGTALLLVGLLQPPAMYRVPLREYHNAVNRGFDEAYGARHLAKREYLKCIPEDAKISVSYSIWPHLDHRKEIAHFPNPFREAYWTDYIPRPYALKMAEYVVIDWNNHLTAYEDKLILKYLMNSQYYTNILWKGSLMILQRIKTESILENGANYSLFLADKPVFIEDDFFKKLPLCKTGKIHNLYFPESKMELRNLLGELVANKKKLALLVTGYIFFPESGGYEIALQSDSPALMEIDGKQISGAMAISKGFHAYRIKYINIDSRFNLKVIVAPPSGQKYIISDQHLFYEKNEKAFAGFVDEFSKRQEKIFALNKSSKNLISNGDFEAGENNKPLSWLLDCWQTPETKGTFGINKEKVKNGNNSCEIQHLGKADSRWTQVIEVRPNTHYKLSGWIKTIDVARLGEGAFMAAEDTCIRTDVLFGTNDWVYMEAEGVTNVNQTSVKVECRLGNWGAPNCGSVYFDKIEFKEVL
ncbi:MAG: DUF2079 domain-containing protein [Candidatus Margulisiibacteriota bacterium]